MQRVPVQGWIGRIVVAVACTAALFGVACSDEPSSTDQEQASEDGHDHGHDFGETGDNFKFALGTPAEPAAADRTVKVEAVEGFAFEPVSLKVAKGETVTFEVTNSDNIEHEFVLGNKDYQELHESQVEAGGVFHNYSDYSVHVMPGETMSIAWTFDTAGRLEFACHVGGHYDRGMFGKIQVS